MTKERLRDDKREPSGMIKRGAFGDDKEREALGDDKGLYLRETLLNDILGSFYNDLKF